MVLNRMYLRDTNAALIVYDSTRQESNGLAERTGSPLPLPLVLFLLILTIDPFRMQCFNSAMGTNEENVYQYPSMHFLRKNKDIDQDIKIY